MSDSETIGLSATNSGPLVSAARGLGGSEGAGLLVFSGSAFRDFVEVGLAAGLVDGVGVALECVAESDLLLTGLFEELLESA